MKRDISFELEFLQNYIDQYFFGGNGVIFYDDLNDLIDLLEHNINKAQNKIDENDFEQAGEFAVTDPKKAIGLLKMNEKFTDAGDIVTQELGEVLLSKNIYTGVYSIEPGSVLPPLVPSVQRKAIEMRKKMLKLKYITEQENGNFLVKNRFSFPVNSSVTLIASVCVGYNVNGKTKIKI